MWDYCKTDETGQGLLQAAMKQMDLAESADIGVAHLAEALQYRTSGWG